jgi:Protein of unknown function (DUF1592)/Protein of unknown function (DUF1588)/Protein of unknown function (DUF1587)/Protein of unknown function (DUF1585)/Protein of unknown function (DUF1595)
VAWEKVVTKLRAGLMPPAGAPRPDETAYNGLRVFVQAELDRAAAAHPDPGRTETFHRLNRDEYRNSIRDLLTLDIDAEKLLPADDSSNGFDNMAGTLRMSQSLMERYLAAAKSISRLAVGDLPPAVESKIYRVASDLQQHDRMEGLPFGTRGGTLIQHLFPRNAEYEIKVELSGARASADPHQLEIAVDGEQLKLFSIGQRRRTPGAAAEKIEVRAPLTGGPHEISVTFFRRPLDLTEQIREPFQSPRVSGNDGGPAGSMPEIASVTIVGPYNDRGPGDSPSRRTIFVCHPAAAGEEPACAKTILSKLVRRAYRGPVRDEDLKVLLAFYEDGRKDGSSFEAGIEFALRRLLVSPEFLFRIEADPPKTASKTGVTVNVANAEPSVYRLSDLDLASRLSFFLWSSVPDDALLRAAEQARLKDPAVLERQVERMLADPRSEALTQNFAGQWLQLRNLDSVRPGDPFSLAFDDSLRIGLRRETELFFDSIVRENRSVLDLLTANYTFLNERVALHYGIPNVIGSEFRRVELPADSPRRGILGQGSILTITSHPNRTSPVLRGKWILKNILGTPPPDPPAVVPALDDHKTQAKVSTLRDRLAAHRAVEPCRTCHAMIDPAGFALENFDAIGRWRAVDESWNLLDTSGVLPDGTKFQNVTGLRAALVRRPERFANTVAEKLLTYALGRGLEYYDMPAVRKIVSDSAPDYKLQSMILSVVRSYPFLMRRSGAVAPQNATTVAKVQFVHP